MKAQFIGIALVALMGCGCTLNLESLSRIEGRYFKPWGGEGVTRPVRVDTSNEALVNVFRLELEKAELKKPFFGYSKDENPSLDFMFKGKLHFASGLTHKIEIFNNGDAIVDTDEEFYLSKKKLDTKAVRDFLELLAE
ncbi:MAG: hypothetical protein E3J72_03220 [Planctomycetota bacterium]|nr:MAG: hypothetical protein E3J72_03220 [Planctomycetota bacterium]